MILRKRKQGRPNKLCLVKAPEIVIINIIIITKIICGNIIIVFLVFNYSPFQASNQKLINIF